MTILEDAVAAVLTRRPIYEEAEQYYAGDVPETFSSAALRRAFKTTGDRSRLNFCRPVVNAVADRMEIANISGDTKAATTKINQIWKDNDLGLEAQEIHRMSLIDGDGYVIAWPGADGDVQISYNSPLNMALVYDPENPRKKLYAVKMWKVSDKESRLNIYTAASITKYRANTGDVAEGTQWTVTETVNNPWNEVPVFHFRTHRPFGEPEHAIAYDAQNAINKLFITNMYTIDYQGAPQRYALANAGSAGEVDDFNEGDTERENAGAMQASPGTMWFLNGISEVGQFQPADAAAFWTPIDKIVSTVSAMTSTPMHYLTDMGSRPTGNSLRVAEAPLFMKISQRELSFGYTWRDIFKFCLKMEGISSDVVVSWTVHESLDELERWDVTLKKINSGLSHQQALREGGYTDDQIVQIMDERQEEANQGLYYQRAPQTRVNTNSDETTPLDGPNATDAQGN